MRKSQAPSLKKFVYNNLEGLKSDHQKNPNSENANEVRNTRTVLGLLLSSEKCENESTSSELLMKSAKNSVKKNVVSEEWNKTTEIISKPSITVYHVVYGKPSKKKHKTWEGNGTLEISSKHLTLKNEEGKVLDIVPCSKMRKLEEGSRVCIGAKEIELLELANEKLCDIDAKENNSVSVSSDSKRKSEPKVKGCTKGFICPQNVAEMFLPEPNAQHQWHFNEKGLLLTPVYVEKFLSAKLRDHQRDGITFMYECIMGFKDKNFTGVILADEMGLGKTLQCITLIWTLLNHGPYGNKPVVKKVLIVTPSSLTMSWYNEFIKWLGRNKITPYIVNQKNKPCDIRSPLMIISYEMLVRYYEDVEKHDFDLLICDEGHRLKNANIRTTQMLNRLNCSKRILLTGTPIQNDLQEFYALVDFVNPNILGTASEFRHCFEEPILASRQPDASDEVIALGKERGQELKRITSKFLLRRTRDILKKYLPPRHELVLFCKITEVQENLYNSLIQSLESLKKKSLKNFESLNHLELILGLRKICSHPCLYRKDNFLQNMVSNEIWENGETPAIEVSSKVLITVNFLRELKEASPKEKVVLVSNSTQTLDLLEKILESLKFSTSRLDGSTPVAQRNELVERFNSPCGKSFVFLLSAKAGGVGLNLTGASRLILFDSDWNPANDLQAIGRIWRDGQKYSVFIYRLLTAGTIEEKIYMRQISKQGLCESTIDPENAKSIKLSKEELKDIFSPCSVTSECLTHDALSCGCSKQGEIPVPELEPDERSCQLIKHCKSSLKMSELFHWEHHGRPFDDELLSQLCLSTSKNEISFIFRSCKN